MCNCNLTTCRYNTDGKCENEEKRKECVEVSRKVLCIPEKVSIVQAERQEDEETMLFVDGKFINEDYACDESRERGQTGVCGRSKILELCLENNENEDDN